MTVHMHTPNNAPESDDNIRIMPTSDDLKRPHSEQQLIDEAMAEFNRPENLIASSRQSLPQISVNGVAIDPKAIASEMQYHPADSQEDAMFLAAQALTVRELLRQAAMRELGASDESWQQDEEGLTAKLLEQMVIPQAPDKAVCQQYYEANQARFVTPPIMQVRHILLASPPEAGEERLNLKKQASELIETLKHSQNKDADFIMYAAKLSACPSKNDGGDLGVIERGQTVPEFESAVFELPVGVGVNPIETRYGIHIVDVMEKKDGVALSFEEAYPMIDNQLKQQSFHHALCDYLFELSAAADIEGIELEMNQENTYRG